LKVRKAIKETAYIQENELHRLRGTVDCDKPRPELEVFWANVNIEDKTYSLDSRQLLLRVRNVLIATANVLKK
jgi:hypothetical protein